MAFEACDRPNSGQLMDQNDTRRYLESNIAGTAALFGLAITLAIQGSGARNPPPPNL